MSSDDYEVDCDDRCDLCPKREWCYGDWDPKEHEVADNRNRLAAWEARERHINTQCSGRCEGCAYREECYE